MFKLTLLSFFTKYLQISTNTINVKLLVLVLTMNIHICTYVLPNNIISSTSLLPQ
jgi:hypothetical protein